MGESGRYGRGSAAMTVVSWCLFQASGLGGVANSFDNFNNDTTWLLLSLLCYVYMALWPCVRLDVEWDKARTAAR
ncbi:hypothetical protein Ddc_00472 [Ditylenchus destructor]|nr:hypothetical protein Ddc_00472 [Ditylenchus destructor]